MPEDYPIVVHQDGWRTVEPKPSADALKAFYAQEYFQQSHGTYAQAYTETELAHRDLLSDLLLHAVAQARGDAGGGLLEIGSGEGWLLKAADRAGYDVRGVDFSADGMARNNPQFLDRLTTGDAFETLDGLIAEGAAADVLVMEHVLEHVIDPEGLLERLPRLMRPGGVAAITVPNDFSPIQLAARTSGRINREFWLAPPQHLNYFNAETLPRLLGRKGFSVRLAFASFPIDWYLMHPGSNYVMSPEAGKPAHQARMAIDLMLAENGLDAWLTLSKALFGCGAGRSLTVIAAPEG